MHDLSWLLLGDFNILRDNEDTTLSNSNLHCMIDFNQLISDLQLQEFPLISRNYTWSNKMQQPSFFKLDMVLLSAHWAALTSHTSFLLDLPATTFDFVPLSLRFKRIDNSLSRSYHFERYFIIIEGRWRNSSPSLAFGTTYT
jgi:hypothetical protein